MKLTLSLTYDTETFKIDLTCDPKLTIALGQALCQEGLHTLDEKRRLAFVQQLQAQAQEEAIRAAIAANTKTREV